MFIFVVMKYSFMQELIVKIKEQEKIANQLEVNLSDRKQLLDKVSAFANQFIEELPNSTSFTATTKASDKLAIKTPISIEALIKLYQSEVIDTGIKAASGGHVGYIPGGGIYTAALGDFLAAISNEYAGVFYASPGAVTIENEVINWLKDVFSFPKTAVGNLASGGSISNLIALAAARDKHQIKNEKITKSVVYLSVQVHHCIQKALKIIGLEDVIIRYIDLDENHKINTAILEQLIKTDKSNGLRPFLVIASAGTTDTGAIDPLTEIGNIAHQHNLWFHVDAAYGGFFVMTSKKHLFEGMETADSLVVDPHKGMFLPYGLGAVLVKDKEALLHSNLYTANYMQDAMGDELTNSPANVSPELTKHFRGLRLWLPLQLHGVKPFIACLEEKLLLTTYFREQLVEQGFEVGPEPDLSVSYFWYPAKENANEFNKKLMEHIHQDGSVFLSSTVVNEKFVIRMAILSFRTKFATIDKALAMIKRSLEKTKQELGK
jgi:glutamate/tyrosine decarboxylase-like PLP-dependent enzyme